MHKGADLFYKCHFQTRPEESLEDPLWTLVLLIRTWICRKHRSISKNIHDWTSEVKYGGELRNANGSVRIKSRLYRWDDSTGLMWACQIEEFSDGADDGVTGTSFAGSDLDHGKSATGRMPIVPVISRSCCRISMSRITSEEPRSLRCPMSQKSFA